LGNFPGKPGKVLRLSCSQELFPFERNLEMISAELPENQDIPTDS
jgi:hypothetical protein